MSGSNANTWKLRLSTEGADQVVRDLRAASTESAAAARAYDTLIKAQPQLATGMERAEQALRKNTDAMRGMASAVGTATPALSAAAEAADKVASASQRARGALFALSNAVPALAPVAGAVSGLVDTLGLLTRGAVAAETRFAGLGAAIGAMAGPVAAVGLGLLGVVSHISQAGEASLTTAEAMRGWSTTLDAVAPRLERVARAALAAANAQRVMEATALEAGYGRVLDRRGSIIGEQTTADAA